MPELTVETVEVGKWNLFEQDPEQFTMLVFHRGLHRPVCKNYLRGLENGVEEFRSRGVGVIVISGGTRERAEEAKREWELERFTIGYGQSSDSMREWWLFVSHAIKPTEPDLFGGPGLFLILQDGTVHYRVASTAASIDSLSVTEVRAGKGRSVAAMRHRSGSEQCRSVPEPCARDGAAGSA